MKKKFFKSVATFLSVSSVAKELGRLNYVAVKTVVWRLPTSVLRVSTKKSVQSPWDQTAIAEMIGAILLDSLDDLGPLYGKMAQIGLSRVPARLQGIVKAWQLERIYDQWPPLPFEEISQILDREIPAWRKELQIEEKALGVASMAQVHAASDRDGNEWVIKVIKPESKLRLMRSLAALDEILVKLKAAAITRNSKRLIKEISELSAAFKRECDLSAERKNLEKARLVIQARSHSLVKIPKVHPSLSTQNVLIMERFRGLSLSQLIAHPELTTEKMRQSLAQDLLKELLIQIFEIGLFHADPHAGNLMLTDDGGIGIFDWGLAGELLESDRQHIAAILRAVIVMDMQALAGALQNMAEDEGQVSSKKKIEKELRRLAKKIATKKAAGQNIGMQTLIEDALDCANRAGIAIPAGLVIMAKTLVTVEGLAKGIDPKISLRRIAGPVLWKAAKPGFKEVWQLARRLPKFWSSTGTGN